MNLTITQENVHLLLPSKLSWMANMLAEDRGISIVEANGGGNVNGGIYSLCGRLISTDPASLPRLPKGVYIVNGNKVIVK